MIKLFDNFLNENIDFKIPIEKIENNILVSKDKYKLILRVSPINSELQSEEELEKIAESIQSAISSYKGRYGIYILSEKADINENLKNIDTKLKNTNNQLDIDILKEQRLQLVDITKTSKSVLGFYLVLETSAKSLDVAEQLLNDSFQIIRNELETVLLFINKLSKQEIMNIFIKKIYSLHSYDLINKNNISDCKPQNATIYQNGISLKIENKYYRFYSIVNIPQRVDRYCWLKKLFNFQGDINIAIILKPKRKDIVMRQMSRSIADNEAFAVSKNVATQKKYMEKVESAKQIIDDISREDIELFDVNFFISISANTIEELDRLNVLLMGKLGSMYMKTTAIVRKEFEPFYSMLPILVDNKLTEKLTYNLTSRDIASIIPFDQAEFLENSGVLLGNNISSGGGVVVDFRNKIYNNSNMCIIGDSGCGKTVFLKTMQIRNIPYTDYTIVFDIKGDYSYSFAKKFIFSPESNLIINPFHIRSAFTEKEINVGRYLSQKIMELIVFFKWIIPKMSPFEEALLEEDIRECYRRCGLTFDSKDLPEEFCTMQTLSHVMAEKLAKDTSLTELEIERRKYVKACLNPYIKGAYAEIFNGKTNWDFDKFTILDVSNTPEAVRKPLYDILLRDVWQFAKKDGTIKPKRKDIYIDEAHEFADERNTQTFEFLSRKLVKEGRGFGVRTVTATQNLTDFLALTKWGHGILDNSNFKIFMKMGENDLNIAKNLYTFSKSELKIVQGTEAKGRSVKGKGILCIGKQKILIQNSPSDKEDNIGKMGINEFMEG